MLSPISLITFLLPIVAAAPAGPSILHGSLEGRKSHFLSPRAGPAAGTIITQCNAANQIALTFDDGPYQYEASLVSKLNAAGAKATFFVTGTLYNCIYNQATQLKATYAAGHQIASHSWTHANLAGLSAAQITTEMQKLEVAFSNILGVKPTYMRPPNGATGGSVVSVMKTMGYRIVTWDVDSGDWNNVGVAASEAKFSGASTSAGHIPLMHETIASTVNELVPWVLNWAKGKGLQMVTVAECVGDAGGAYTTPVAKTGATTC